MGSIWYPTVDRPRGNPILLLGAAYLISGSTLLIPHGLVRIGLGVSSLILIPCRARSFTVGKSAEDHLIGINFFVLLLRWIDFVVLRNPEVTLHRVSDNDVKKNREDAQNMDLRHKSSWAFSLFTTWRGIGWNWRVKNIQSVAPVSRFKFILQQLGKFVRAYCLIDLMAYFQRQKPFGSAVYQPFRQTPLLSRTLICWCIAIRLVCEMSIGYHLCACLSIILKISEPQSWPDVFGPWNKAYTVRNLWGSCWHQWLRRIFESYTNIIVSTFNLRRGSFLSRYTKLYCSFLISATIHHAGSFNVPYIPGARSQFLFFMMQPIIISLEDAIIHIGKKYGIHKSWKTKALGFGWVFIAFSLTLPYFIDSFIDWANLDGKAPSQNPLLIWSPTQWLFG